MPHSMASDMKQSFTSAIYLLAIGGITREGSARNSQMKYDGVSVQMSKSDGKMCENDTIF